jgi:hypothetical protein
MESNDSKNPVAEEPGVNKQTDLAEGELETVEECIRIHEQKGDLPRDPGSSR